MKIIDHGMRVRGIENKMNEPIMKLLEENYDLSAKDRENVVYSCAAADLLDQDNMKRFLERYTPMVKGKEQSVGEIYMANWFRGPMLGLFHLLSAWNKSLHLTLNNLTVQIYSAVYNEQIYYRCGFLMNRSELIEGPEKPLDNIEWTKECLGGYFEHTVRPIFESIARVGSLQIGMLWSQLPTSLEYGYELLMKSDESEHVKKLLTRNYHLMKSLDGQRFGRNKNPLDVKFRMTESMENPDTQVRLKSACCLYYLVEDGYYCFTCPRLKESEREERRLECRAEKQV